MILDERRRKEKEKLSTKLVAKVKKWQENTKKQKKKNKKDVER